VKKESIVIFGGSSGLGLGISCGLAQNNEPLYLVSRTRPVSLERKDEVERTWIQTDLSCSSCIDDIKRSLDGIPIKLIVFCAGTWESSPNMHDIAPNDIYTILNVNTSSFIASVISLEGELRLAKKQTLLLLAQQPDWKMRRGHERLMQLQSLDLEARFTD
jgi:short-subunit dehydrogenase